MKRLFTVIFGLFMFSEIVFPSKTRIDGLGISNWMVEDDYNIWFSPSRIIYYPKSVWCEIGDAPAPQPSTQWAGVSYENKQKVIALFISRPYTSILNNLGNNPSGSDVASIPTFITPNVTNSPAGMGNMSTLIPQNKFDLFLGKKISNDTLFGMRFNLVTEFEQDMNQYQSSTASDFDGTAKIERTSYEPVLVFGVKRNKGTRELDLVLNMGFPYVINKYEESYYIASQAQNTFDNRTLKTDNSFMLGLTARLISKSNDNFKRFSFIDYNLTNLNNTYTEYKDTNADGSVDVHTEQKRKQNISNLTLGIAANSKATDKILLITGLEFNMTQSVNNTVTSNKLSNEFTEEYNYTSNSYNIPLKVGIEYKASKIFTPRAGINKNIFEWTTNKINDPDWNTSPNEISDTRNYETIDHIQPTVNINIGLEIKPWKELCIDTVIDYDILYSGGYLVSGVSNRPFTRISIVYSF